MRVWTCAVLLGAGVIGCRSGEAAAPVEATPPAAVVALWAPMALGIFEVEDGRDVTSGGTAPPEGIAIFREKGTPSNGFFLATGGGSQKERLVRLDEWCSRVAVPEGDRILFGVIGGYGVRTYLVKRDAVVDASGVAGAMATAVSGDSGWGVALTFTPEAHRALISALSSEGRRFRLVVQGLVEQDIFELVDERSSVPLAGPHGALSNSDWICSDHRAVLTMTTRGGASAKARAEGLAAALPHFRSAADCRTERWFRR